MNIPHPDDHDNLATRPEAVREWAYNCGAPADQAWILHDWDVWTKNPRYDGPPVPHPEDMEPSPWYERGFAAAAARAKARAAANGTACTVVPVEGFPHWFEVR